MEPDDALSIALKKLAEDVVKECDLKVVSVEEQKKYDESLILSSASSNLFQSPDHTEKYNGEVLQPDKCRQVSGSECPQDVEAISCQPRGPLHDKSADTVNSFSDEGSFSEPREHNNVSVNLHMVEPPQNIDPQDPSFLAIKEAFSRCLNQIKELKTKLALAVKEINQLRQEKDLAEMAKHLPESRDIATETEAELPSALPIKQESTSCTNNFSPAEKKIDSELQQNLTKDGNISNSSSSAIVIQRRQRRKRQTIQKVEKQNCIATSDEEEDISDESFVLDGSDSSDNDEECEAGNEKKSNSTGVDIKTESLSPLSPRLSRRKSDPRKQAKPKKKKLKTGFYACEICFKSYNRAIDLRKHKLTHSKNADNDYECEICKATFKRYADIEKHSRTHRVNPAIKPEPTSFPCSLCDKVLPDRLALKRHKKSHPKLCPICNVSISCKNYSTHLRGHTGEKPYKCKQCAMSFVGPRHLARHVRVHTGEKPYSCTVCNKSFSEAGALRTHARRHTGERPYVCETCGKAFAQLTGLTYHIRTHTGEKPYACDVCNKSFAQVTGLENHKRTHTGEKPYCCDICGRCFAVAITFTQHKRTHTGEKPYKCDVCTRAFTTGGALHRHKVIHAGVKPHVCVICAVAFARLGDLQRHVRIHTGIRPFKCETCGKAFSRRSHLQAHGKTHGDKVNLRPRAKALVQGLSVGMERHSERFVQRPMDMAMDRQIEHPLEHEQVMMEQSTINPIAPRTMNSAEAAPMYLGVGNRGQKEMSYPNRPVFPDRTPVVAERHTMTPDSTSTYQDRGGMGQDRVNVAADQRSRPGADQDRPGSVHERPAHLQEFMPGLPHHQMNLPPGAYPQWNFSFQ